MNSNIKRILAIAFAGVIVTAAFASCGEQNANGGSSASEQVATISETVEVIGTTPDGGTVERDADNNTITKDKSGEIVSIEDKDGNPVDVEQYVEDHPTAGSKTDKTSKAPDSSSSKTSSKTSGKSPKKTPSKTTSEESGSKSSTVSKETKPETSSSSSSQSSSSSSSGTDQGIPRDNVEVDFNDL